MRTIIALSGRISSGKTYAARLINEEFSYPIVSFGEYLKQYCISEGLSIQRQTLQDIGEKLIKSNPQKFLTDVISNYTNEAPIIILEGVRHRSILNLIKSDPYKCIMIFTEADQKTRFERYSSRIKITDPDKSWNDFIARDNHPVELEIESLKVLSDLVIDTTSDYKQTLYNFISQKIIQK